MKAILSLLSAALLLLVQRVNAQQFSPTTGVPCVSCVPADWNAIGTPFISDIEEQGIDVLLNKYFWYIYMGVLDNPPSIYSQTLPVGAGKNSFVSLKTSEGPLNDKLYLDVSGFDVNKTYVFKYSVCGAAIYDEDDNTDAIPTAESATMEIITVGQNPNVLVASQTTSFPDHFTQQHWTTRAITFQPLSSTLRFRLSGKTPGQVPRYVHFSIDKYPFECQIDYAQATLFRSTINTIFPNDKLDLSTVLVTSPTPANTELVWKAGPNATDQTLTTQEAAAVSISNLDPANIKPYYAFYYAKNCNAYSAQVSQAQLKFMHVPTQVPLKNSYISVSCTKPNADLTALLDNPIAPVVWYTTNNHQGSQLFNPQAAPPGDYYAFYYNLSKGGFSLLDNTVSTAHVTVAGPIIPGTPDLGPTMSINSLIFPQNGSKDFVIKIENIANNSNCSVFFKVTKLPGFTITYSPEAGQSNVDGGTFNNNDKWEFSEDDNFITVTSKTGIAALNYSNIGFKMTRNANTPANTAQNVTVVIPQQGGGGELNTANNIAITTVNTAN